MGWCDEVGCDVFSVVFIGSWDRKTVEMSMCAGV